MTSIQQDEKQHLELPHTTQAFIVGFGVFDIRSTMFSRQLPFIRRLLVSIWI
jgi:hypothetical protein